MQKLVETAAPGAEPLTRDEVKLHLRVSSATDDALIDGLITAARQMCENYTGLSLITRSYSLYLDSWPETPDGVLRLPRPPLAAVSGLYVSDESGAAAALPATDYTVDTAARPGRVVLASPGVPPLPGVDVNGIEIRFTAGYGATADDVPALLRLGMKQLAGWFYARRGDAAAPAPDAALTLSGAESLFRPYRMARLS